MKCSRGFSLVEVVIALVVFGLAAIPIYYALSGTAAQEVDATKLSMARKILESFKAEVLTLPFDKLKEMTTTGGTVGGCTNTETSVLGAQRKYKDFEFTTEIKVSTSSPSVLDVKGAITWTKSDGSKAKPEELAFIVVEP